MGKAVGGRGQTDQGALTPTPLPPSATIFELCKAISVHFCICIQDVRIQSAIYLRLVTSVLCLKTLECKEELWRILAFVDYWRVGDGDKGYDAPTLKLFWACPPHHPFVLKNIRMQGRALENFGLCGLLESGGWGQRV